LSGGEGGEGRDELSFQCLRPSASLRAAGKKSLSFNFYLHIPYFHLHIYNILFKFLSCPPPTSQCRSLSKDDCSGKGLRIWLENLRILNFATHILWFSICIFLKKILKNTKEIQNILQKIQNGGIRF
jgi:hypothetical protein